MLRPLPEDFTPSRYPVEFNQAVMQMHKLSIPLAIECLKDKTSVGNALVQILNGENPDFPISKYNDTLVMMLGMAFYDLIVNFASHMVRSTEKKN